MKRDEEDKELHQAFAELALDTHKDLPSADELAAFRDGTLPSGEAERLLDRAAVDPELAQLLVDAEAFPNLKPTRQEKAVQEAFPTRKGWNELRAQLVDEQLLGSVAEDKQAKGKVASLTRRRWRQQLALAAALVVGIGIGFFLPRGSSGPIVNPTLIELQAKAFRTRLAEVETLRPNPAGLELVFDLDSLDATGDLFEVRLYSPLSYRGETQRTAARPVEDALGNLTLRVIWVAPLVPGEYRIELWQAEKLHLTHIFKVTS